MTSNPYTPPPNSKRARALPRFLAVLVGLGAVRVALHLALYRDPVGLLQIVALDAGSLLMALLGFTLVAFVLGRTFASLTLTLVGLGLPIAGIGAIADALGGTHLSRLAGLVALLGVGAGACVAGGVRRGAGLLGLIVLGGATLGLTRIHQTLESLIIAAPCLILGAAEAVRTRAGLAIPPDRP